MFLLQKKKKKKKMATKFPWSQRSYFQFHLGECGSIGRHPVWEREELPFSSLLPAMWAKYNIFSHGATPELSTAVRVNPEQCSPTAAARRTVETGLQWCAWVSPVALKDLGNAVLCNLLWSSAGKTAVLWCVRSLDIHPFSTHVVVMARSSTTRWFLLLCSLGMLPVPTGPSIAFGTV